MTCFIPDAYVYIVTAGSWAVEAIATVCGMAAAPVMCLSLLRFDN